MAEETPNPGQGVPDEEDEEGDAQQTLDDLTVLTEGEQADTGAEVQGVSGGEAEPEDRTLGTIHSGSQQTENEILDNLAPQQAPIVEVPEIAESEIQDRGVQVADIQTATIDAGTESEGETSGIGGSRSFGPGDGPAGTGLDRAGGNDGGVAGRQRDGAPDETGGGAADDGGVENVPVTPTPVTPTAGETPPTETPVVAATETPTVPVVKPPVPETAPALNEELLASAPTPTPAPVPANVAPVAADDTGATGEDAGVTINVLANDTDADGGTLSVTGATLPDGVDGTVVVNADGTVSFTPGDAFDALGVGDTQDIEITYTISDGQGGTDTATTTVTVTGTNDGPVASDESVTATEDGGAVTGQLDATDIDGDSLTYTQTGDAVPGLTVNADGSYSFDPGAGYQDLGVGETAEVTFTYEVSDGQGGTSTATGTITVEGTNDGPVAANDAAVTQETASVTLDVLANDTDLDGDSLTVTDVTLPDGVDGTVTINADGTITFEPGPSFNSLAEGDSQNVAITYTISDGQGGTDTATATVTVTGSTTGIITAADTAVTGEDAGVTINVLDNDINLDGGELSVTQAVLPNGEDGSVVVNPDGTISFTPGGSFDALGVGDTQDVEITYTVTNADGATATETVTVTVTGSNDGPVATADVATTGEDSSVTINVLANDTDVDGGTLSVTGATLPDGVDGTVAVNADGTVSFTPGDGFDALGVGETQDVEITYTISDGQGGTSTATATVTVTVTGSNDGPVATADVATTDEDTSVTINVLANDTDADTNDALTVTGATIPGDVDGTVVVNADGTVSFTPGDGFDALGVGETQDVEITYTISDGQGGTSTATATVTVTGSNDGPVATADVATTDESTAVTIDVLANDTDLDGDNLTVTGATLPDGVDGTVVVNADGTVSFTPGDSFATMNDGESQDVEITYTISDGQGGTSTATATVTVDGVGAAPEPDPAPDSGPQPDSPDLSVTSVVGAEDSAIALDINAVLNDLDGGDESLSITITDIPDGAVLSDGTQNADGSWTISAYTDESGALVSVADQLDGLTMTPPQDFYGDINLSVTATSTEAGSGASVSTTQTLGVTVTPEFDAPNLGVANVSGSEDTAIPLDVTADKDPGAVETVVDVIIAGVPDGAVLNAGTNNGDGTWTVQAADLGELTITPPQDYSGDMTLTALATSSDGGTSLNWFNVGVDEVNDGPVAADDTATTDEGSGVTINVLANDTDVDGDVLSVTGATLPDGVDGTVVVNADGTISFTPGDGFDALGVGETQDVVITYTISDGRGGTDTATATVTVEGSDNGPQAFADTATTGEDASVTIDVLANDSDPDGDALSVTGATLPDGVDGTVVVNADGTISFTPGDGFDALGVGETQDVEITYTISDGQGGTDTATATVTVTGSNDGPIASDEAVTATEDGAAVTGQLDATDIDGDNLSYTQTGDAVPGLTINADGSYSFDPGEGYQDLGVGETAEVTFTYEVSDGQGGTSTATGTITVEGTNDGPVASDEAITATEDGAAVTGQLDATDIDGDNLSYTQTGDAVPGLTINADGSYSFDPGEGYQDLGVGETAEVTFTYEVSDGQGGTSTATGTIAVEGTNDGPVASDEAITATEDGAAVTGQLDATDIDGDNLSYTQTGDAVPGLTINADGSYSFDPGEGYQDLGVGETAEVTFTYEVSDGQGGTSTATGTITVEGTNDGPVANADNLSTGEDTALTFNVADLLGNDTDVDGDALSISGITQPDHGSLILNTDGSYTYTPDENYQGADSFTYTVSDGEGGFSTATVNLNVDSSNDQPVAVDDIVNGSEDTVMTFTSADLLSNDSDLDGDTLSVMGFDQPANGTLSYDADTDTFTFTPDENWNGDTSFNYTLADGNGGTDEGAVTLNVAAVNDVPIAADEAVTATEDGAAVTGQLDATDIDGDSLSYTQTGDAVPGLTINADGSYSFDPGEGYQDLGVGETAEVTFTYEVSDGQGGTSTATGTITVEGTNDGPVASDEAVTATEDGAAVTGQLDATDIDGDSLSYTQTGDAVPGLTINADGSYSFDPGEGYQDLGVGETAEVTFTYEVSDGQGGTSTATGTITVEGTNDGPVASDEAITATEDGAAVTGQLDATDIDGDNLSYTQTGDAVPGLTINADGSYSFDPGEGYQDLGVGETAEVTFTYEVSDGQGGTSTATGTITVEGTNDGPVASDEAITATEDGAAVTGQLDATDIDGDNLSYTQTGDAVPGLTINADGSYSFDPGEGYQDLGVGETAEVTFTYEVSDGQGGTSTATGTITVEGTNDGPVAVDDTLAGTEDTAITFTAQDLLSNDSDLDGDSLTITEVTAPDNGTLVDNGDGSYTFTPDENWSGDTSFSYTISDGEGGTSTGTTTIEVGGVADEPTLSVELGEPTAIGDGSSGGTLVSEDFASDASGWGDEVSAHDGQMKIEQDETASKVFDFGSDHAGETVTISFDSDTFGSWDESGTYEDNFTVNANGAEMVNTSDEGSNSFSFQVTLDENGQVQLDLSADTTGSDEGVFIDNLEITSGDDWSGGETSLEYPLDISSSLTDVDGSETLSITIDGSSLPDGAVLSAGTYDEVSDTYTLDPAAGDLAGLTVTVPADAGEFDISVTATSSEDGTTSSVTSTVSVEVNDAPVAVDDELSGSEDNTITFTADDLLANDTDADGDTLTITSVEQPDHGTITDNGDGSYTFTPDENWSGDTSFEYSVSDGEGGTSTATASVSVEAVADAPDLTVDVGDPTSSGGTPSPVGYWKLDEESGTTFEDQISNNDGVAHGEAVSGSGSGGGSGGGEKNNLDLDDDGQFGTAAEFKDKDEQFIEVDHSAALKPDSGSLTLWFNSDESNDGTLASSDSMGFDDGGHFNLSINSDGQLELRMQDEDSSQTISGGDVEKGEWSQVTVTWGEGGMNIYQDGELVASDPDYTGGLQGNENPWTFGASQTHSGDETSDGARDFFDGHIDDIAIFNEQLTSEQITDLYSNGVQDFMDSGSEGGDLVYPLDITAGVTDASESLVVTIDGVPDGATVSEPAVYDEDSGTWSVDGDADMSGMSMTVPDGSGDFLLNVNATSTDSNGDTFTTSRVIEIDADEDGDFDFGTQGTDGDDTLTGTADSDTLLGGDGNDTLDAGAGDDIMVGGEGNDTFEGGEGDDMAFGDSGNDLFIFGAGDGSDYFDGGDGWTDTISLDGVGSGPGVDAGWTLQVDEDAGYTQTENGIEFEGDASGSIQLSDGSELTFEGVDKIEW